jgi:hypothetical protein
VERKGCTGNHAPRFSVMDPHISRTPDQGRNSKIGTAQFVRPAGPTLRTHLYEPAEYNSSEDRAPQTGRRRVLTLDPGPRRAETKIFRTRASLAPTPAKFQAGRATGGTKM